MKCRKRHCNCCQVRDRTLDPATDPQRDFIKELIEEVGREWSPKKWAHACAELVDPNLNKGEASRWINRLLHIRDMQRYWAS